MSNNGGNDNKEEIKGIQVEDIAKSYPECNLSSGEYPPVQDRYYTRFYVPSRSESKNHSDSLEQVVSVHSNRICLVSVLEDEPKLKDKKLVKVNYQVTPSINRLVNHVRGKGKKGGQSFDQNAILGLLHVLDPEGKEIIYPIRSCVKGKLIEVNPRLVNEPELIRDKPLTEGYIAIILPKLPEGLQDIKDRLRPE